MFIKAADHEKMTIGHLLGGGRPSIRWKYFALTKEIYKLFSRIKNQFVIKTLRVTTIIVNHIHKKGTRPCDA